MLIVDSQIHVWKNGRMIAHHRQDPTYSYEDAAAEMDVAGVDCAVIHPPGSITSFSERAGTDGCAAMSCVLVEIIPTAAKSLIAS